MGNDDFHIYHAADIMFYSLIEWALYGGEQHVQDLGGTEMWTEVFTLFHWGPLAWGFYVILAVCFGFMMHVRKRDRQRFSEACRPLLGDKVDGLIGKTIDVIAIFCRSLRHGNYILTGDSASYKCYGRHIRI